MSLRDAHRGNPIGDQVPVAPSRPTRRCCRRHRRLRRAMVVAPEGPPTQDHQRDEEENGAERHRTPLDAEPPEIRLADRRRFEQWSTFGGAGRHSGTERLMGPVRSRLRASTGRARRRHVAAGPRRLDAAACRRDRFARCCPHPDRAERCGQSFLRGEPPRRRARAPAPLRAVQGRVAVRAGAAGAKAQRPPLPDRFARCCPHPDRAERCGQPFLRG